MLVASWRRALRTRTGHLRLIESDGAVPLLEGANAGFRIAEGGTDAVPRGAAEHIVAVESGLEGDGGEEVFGEFGSELAQLVEREAGQFAAFVETVTDGVTDLLVSPAEGHAFVDEVGGGGHGVEEAGLAGGAHAV